MAVEVPMSIAGVAIYALESLIMARPRFWDYFELALDGHPPIVTTIVRRKGCPICSTETGYSMYAP